MALGRITVFGGSGFIGRRLAELLTDRGATVRVAARHAGAAKRPSGTGGAARAEAVRADIRDEAAVRAAVAGAEAVVNLVGVLTEAGRQTFAALHKEGARRVAAAALEAGADRLVHVSALGVGRHAPSAADRTKASGEEAVRAAFPGATIVRPSLVFGPGDHFFTGLAATARRAPALPLIGGGQTRVQPVYVGDVVEALARILAEPETRGRTYELGGPRVYTLRELMELVLRATGHRRMLVSVPYGIAAALAAPLEFLPSPPLTRDQVRLLKTDKVIGGREPTLADLGIAPTALEDVLPTYLR